MGHARLTLRLALDWIEERLAAGQPAPSDADLVDRFNFGSTESARTLLSDLADAGKITIRWHDDGRDIVLGRVRPAAIGTVRAAPPVTRRDVVLEEGLAKISAIVARGRSSAPAAVVPAITAPRPASAPEPVAPAPVSALVQQREEKSVPTPTPTISVPAKGDVLAAIERRAAADDLPLGQATSAIVADWIVGSPAPTNALIDLAGVSTADLLDELDKRLKAGPEVLAAAVARAEQAEEQLTNLRTQIGQLIGGGA